MSSTVENAAQIAKNTVVTLAGGGTAVASPAMSFSSAVQITVSIIGALAAIWGGYHLRLNFKENSRRNDIYHESTLESRRANDLKERELALREKDGAS